MTLQDFKKDHLNIIKELALKKTINYQKSKKLKKMHHDKTRCLGNKCSYAMKAKCWRFLPEKIPKDGQAYVADFTPKKEQNSRWECEYFISKK